MVTSSGGHASWSLCYCLFAPLYTCAFITPIPIAVHCACDVARRRLTAVNCFTSDAVIGKGNHSWTRTNRHQHTRLKPQKFCEASLLLKKICLFSSPIETQFCATFSVRHRIVLSLKNYLKGLQAEILFLHKQRPISFLPAESTQNHGHYPRFNWNLLSLQLGLGVLKRVRLMHATCRAKNFTTWHYVRDASTDSYTRTEPGAMLKCFLYWLTGFTPILHDNKISWPDQAKYKPDIR